MHDLKNIEPFVNDLYNNERFLKLCNVPAHFLLRKVSDRFGESKREHSLRTAILSYNLARILKTDLRSTTRAGLLHDIGFSKPGCRFCKNSRYYNCGLCHPKTGEEIARELNENEKVTAAIKRHMFPLYPSLPPLSRMEITVWLADKIDGLLYSLYLTTKIMR